VSNLVQVRLGPGSHVARLSKYPRARIDFPALGAKNSAIIDKISRDGRLWVSYGMLKAAIGSEHSPVDFNPRMGCEARLRRSAAKPAPDSPNFASAKKIKTLTIG